MDAESILSFYCGSGHDANLSVYINSKPAYTIELERVFGNRYFTRMVNPFSIYSCGELNEASTVSGNERLIFIDKLKEILRSKKLFENSYSLGLFDWGTPKEVVDLLTKKFDIKAVRHEDEDVTSHHKAHAALAFYTSGFEDALIFSYDGGGNDGTFCVYDLERSNPDFRQLNEKFQNPFPTKYARICNFIKEIRKPVLEDTLGTETHEHNGVSYPGKIMGLSAYGSFNKQFYDSCYDYFNDEETQNISQSYINNFGLYSFNDLKEKDGYDLAYNAQLAFEDTFLKLFEKFADAFSHRKNICLTGGGALNVLLNERLSKTYPDKKFFVPCSPGDSGLSYGMIAHYLTT